MLFENYQLKSDNNELKENNSELKDGIRMTETLLGLSESELDTSLQENNKLKEELKVEKNCNNELKNNRSGELLARQRDALLKK